MSKLNATNSSTMGIRMTAEQREALDRISQKTGVDVSQLIRFAVDAIIEHYQRSGERLVLPIDFSEIVGVPLSASGATSVHTSKLKKPLPDNMRKKKNA